MGAGSAGARENGRLGGTVALGTDGAPPAKSAVEGSNLSLRSGPQMCHP